MSVVSFGGHFILLPYSSIIPSANASTCNSIIHVSTKASEFSPASNNGGTTRIRQASKRSVTPKEQKRLRSPAPSKGTRWCACVSKDSTNTDEGKTPLERGAEFAIGGPILFAFTVAAWRGGTSQKSMASKLVGVVEDQDGVNTLSR